jgi:small-conductance mechanosensitive channel
MYMETLDQFAATLLKYLNLSPDLMFLGNSMAAYALAVVIFLIGLAVFALVQHVILSWIGAIARRTETDLDDAFVKIVHSFRPPFYLFLAFWLALRPLEITGLADNIVTAILLLWVIYQAVIVVGIFVEEVVFHHLTKERDENTKSALHLLTGIAKGVMWVLGVLLVLSNFGIDVTSLVAGAGIVGIAVAFALQGILSDLFSSFSLYFDKPFKIGDFIIVGDTMGIVKHIGIKSTRIRSLSGEEVVLSNKELTNTKIRNFKLMEKRRIVFSFSVVYQTPSHKVREIPAMLREIIEQCENVSFDRAHFKGFAESSLEFEVVYHVLKSDYGAYMDIQQDINLKILERFEQEDIHFAFPTRTVHLHQ